MNCHSGSPCYSHGTVVYPRGCGIDPCHAHKTGTDLVFYNGANLPCVGVDTCDSVTLSFQKIDQKLCPDALALAVFGSITNNLSIQNMFCTLVNACIPPTTTTTTTIAPTTTTTTTSTPTTTTTTTITPFTCNPCVTYLLINNTASPKGYSYTNCYGLNFESELEGEGAIQICVCGTTLVADPEILVSPVGAGCNPTPTTTTTTSSSSTSTTTSTSSTTTTTTTVSPTSTTTTTTAPTTTTTTTSSSTTTTTTTITPTTTTTTTLTCTEYNLNNPTPNPLSYSYLSCVGVDTGGTVTAGNCVDFFAATGSVVFDDGLVLGEGACF